MGCALGPKVPTNLKLTSGGLGVGVGGGGGKGPMKRVSPGGGGGGYGVGGGGLRRLARSVEQVAARVAGGRRGANREVLRIQDRHLVGRDLLVARLGLAGPRRRRLLVGRPHAGASGRGGGEGRRGRLGRSAARTPAHDREDQHDRQNGQENRLLAGPQLRQRSHQLTFRDAVVAASAGSPASGSAKYVASSTCTVTEPGCSASRMIAMPRTANQRLFVSKALRRRLNRA